MKKLFIIAMLTLLFAGQAFANPFLVCDPQAGVEEYQLLIDGVVIDSDPSDSDIDTFPAQLDGSALIELSQFNLPDGEHTYILVAMNAWGQATSDPFVNFKIVPVSSTGMGLSK